MNYRGPEMATLSSGLIQKLKTFVDTSYDTLLLTTSGTGGLEAAVVNSMSPGDRVVAVDAGVFGKRFSLVAGAYGASVRVIDVPWGRSLEPDALQNALREEPDCRAVLLTHNETSTATMHPLEQLCRVVREETDACLLVDAVSSLGAMPLPMESLGIDVVITGSQKAWGVPPGMAMLFVSERFWTFQAKASTPKFFFDLARYRDAQAKGSFPFTPALPIVFALDVALDFMLRETPAGVFARHERVAQSARDGLEALGLTLFGDRRHPSATVTAFRVPEGIDEAALVARLRERHDTVIARGQESLRGAILRIGHLGWVQQDEVDRAVRSIGDALSALGFSSE